MNLQEIETLLRRGAPADEISAAIGDVVTADMVTRSLGQFAFHGLDRNWTNDFVAHVVAGANTLQLGDQSRAILLAEAKRLGRVSTFCEHAASLVRADNVRVFKWQRMARTARIERHVARTMAGSRPR